MLALRRRYLYPCADLVTGRPAIDRALDSALASANPGHRRPRITVDDEVPALVVLGFPRSGNTYLTHWLEWTARPDTVVLDGRMTHSALDVHRVVRSSASVVIPVRPPLATCASWLVRADCVDDPDFARQTLRSFAAWYRVAARAVGRSNVVVSDFDASTCAPWRVSAAGPVSPLVQSPDLTDMPLFHSWLDDQLRDVVGQGQPLDGVPAHQMISVPHQGRAGLLEHAAGTLQHDALRGHFSAAVDAYFDLVAHADQRGTFVSAIDPVDALLTD